MRTSRVHQERLTILLGKDISPSAGAAGLDTASEATNQAYRALLVIFTDQRTHEWLDYHDPKALEQVGDAIKELHKVYGDRPEPTVDVRDDGTPILGTEQPPRSEAKEAFARAKKEGIPAPRPTPEEIVAKVEKDLPPGLEVAIEEGKPNVRLKD